MNIFAPNEDPTVSAQVLPDKLIVKMILESAQMLSTAIVEHRPMTVHTKTWKLTYRYAHISPFLAFWCRCQPVYAPAHKNHPCTLWVKIGDANWLWLYEHATAMHDEYRLRYGSNKTHKSLAIIEQLGRWFDWIPAHEQTAFAQAMPDEFKHTTNAHIAYRRYIRTKSYFENGYKKGRDFSHIFND